jgi:hypothetical protein
MGVLVTKDGNQGRLDMGRVRRVPLHDPSLPAKAGNPGAASPVLASPLPASTLPERWRLDTGRPERAALDSAKPGDDGFSGFGRDNRAAVIVKGTTRRRARRNRPPPMTSLGAASAWRLG